MRDTSLTRRTRRPRAYTIVEVALVLFLISVLSATSVYMFGGSRVQGSDALAQSTADAVIDSALSILQSEGALASVTASRLAMEHPDITFKDSPLTSTLSSEASVIVSAGVVAVAVRADDGSCWMARVSLLGDASQPLRVYSISPTGSKRDCSGARALETSSLSSAAGRGSSWRKPIVWGDQTALLIAEAAVLLRAGSLTSSDQVIRNEGTAGSVLDATLGTSTAADANDPLFLPYSGIPYVYLPGRSGNAVTTPHTTTNSVTSDIDVRVRVALSSWSTASTQTFAGKWQSSSNLGWMFGYNGTSNRLTFSSSSDGTTAQTATASASFSPANGTAYWLRATKVYNTPLNGSTTTFYYSPDQGTEPTSWSTVGIAQTLTGQTSSYASTLALTLGGQALGAGNNLTGTLYAASVRSGVAGTVVARFDSAACNSATQTCAGGNAETWSILRAGSGVETALVTRAALVFGSSPGAFIRTSTSSLLDVPASQSVTIVLAGRVHSTPSSSYLVSRYNPASSTTPGWAIRMTAVANQTETVASSGGATPLTASALNTLASSSSTTFIGRFEGVFGRTTSWTDTLKVTGTGISTPWPALTSSLPFVIGATATAATPTNFADMEMYAVAVFTRSLSDTEVTRVISELAAS